MDLSKSIIVVENGDVSFFESKSVAERCIEPIDVANGEFIIYDVEGYIYDLSIRKKETKFFWIKTMVDSVAISECKQKEHYRPNDLKKAILCFFESTGGYEKEYADMSLNELIEKAIKQFDYSV